MPITFYAKSTLQPTVTHRENLLHGMRVQDRQLTQAQTYNIITHRPVVGEPAPAPRRTKVADTRQQFNILSNLDFSEHHHAPPGERPIVDIPAPRRLLKSAESKAEKRVYDVLTNKCVAAVSQVYLQGH